MFKIIEIQWSKPFFKGDTKNVKIHKKLRKILYSREIQIVYMTGPSYLIKKRVDNMIRY